MKLTKVHVAAGTLLVLAGVCGALWFFYERPFHWPLPAGVPLPAVPADNPMSDVKVALGRRLFYDERLSVTGTMSCATCHRQSLAFTDGLPRSVGATGERHPRGSMSLVNVAYASRLTWANHLLARLETQALTPMFGEQPIEMGLSGRESTVTGLLRHDPYYRNIFPQAFPGDADPYSVLNTVRALSTFVRTIVSFESPYDRYLRGDQGALSAAQVRGLGLFFSERLECFHCHGGLNFTDSSTHADASVESVGFHNNGLYNIDGAGGYPPENTGLLELTGDRWDTGRFKAPTLRNIAVTAPYMHDGSIVDLPAVIDHYARGGRRIDAGPYAGDGSRNPYKSEFLRGFELTAEEHSDLLAFLESLTDRKVLTDEALADPGPYEH
ncbi:MAG TPA: di-heme enzyme [Woeseiaceae bacterium]|nr:di-heme enzyme [Woeseiaceae bacterium]